MTICAIAGSLLFAAGSSSFADAFKPIIHSIFTWKGDKGLSGDGSGAQSAASELPILAERESNGYILRIHEAKYDGLRLSFSYSLVGAGKQDGRKLYITPAFQLDSKIKKLDPGMLKSDSGAKWGEDRVGIVNYFFDQDMPDLLELHVTVPQLAFMNGEDHGQTTVPGDWSFQLDVRKTGSVSSRLYGADNSVTEGGALFRATGSRNSPLASEWRLKWELPQQLVDRYMESGRYRMKYSVQTDHGEVLSFVTEVTSHRIDDRTLPLAEQTYLEDIRLLAEPVASGTKTVTITPVLMDFPETEKEAYKEVILKQFSIVVPITDAALR
ncbi:hypothetical protein JOC55_001964 [Paenibacillus sacheonensis]|nr:hypothetical protein [Paenibacillus sacheonensis]